MNKLGIVTRIMAILGALGVFIMGTTIYMTAEMRELATGFTHVHQTTQAAALDVTVASQAVDGADADIGWQLIATNLAEKQHLTKRLVYNKQRFDNALNAAAIAFPARAGEFESLRQRGDVLLTTSCGPAVALGQIFPEPPGMLSAKNQEVVDCQLRVAPVVAGFNKLVDESQADVAHDQMVLNRAAGRAIVYTMISIFLGVVAVLLGGFFAVRTWVVKPIKGLQRTMVELAGGELQVRVNGIERKDEIGDMARAVQVFKDAALKKRQLEEEARAAEALAFRVLEATSDAVIVFDRTGRAKYANAKATDLLGFGSPLTNRSVSEIFKSGPPPLLIDALNRGVDLGENSHTTFFCDILKIWAELNIYVGAENVSLFLRDISDKKRAEEQLSYAARHDFLTGTLNRGEFFARLRETIAQQALGTHTALFCLDLDNFKDINDIHGHPVGDRLLQLIVERLSSLIGASDFLARAGGDEFMLAQTGIAHQAEAMELAERIVQAMGRSFIINGLVISACTSIGIAISAQDLLDIEAIYKQADLALYQVKTNAKGNFLFFHADMQANFDRAHWLRLDLKKARESGELYLEFQPIIRVSDGGIIGAEALLRWRHPTHGLISPAEFIPIAEESGLICDIGAWVLHQACHAARHWPLDATVSVNVSPRQFELDDIVQTVSDALRLSGLTPDRLNLEITESVFISKESSNLYVMNELQSLGVNLVLDDFGTGYSSLSYLDTFRFDVVKIDKSFIAKIDDSQKTQPILEAIIGITSALKLSVTAEGVETQEQFDHIRRLGCQYAQGYLLGVPAAEAVLLQCLKNIEDSCAVRAAGVSTEPFPS